MRKTLKKLLLLASAAVLTLGISTMTYAADDFVLNDSGSPFIKTFDPGTSGEYKYLGYVYCFEAGPEYKYLQITYTGDSTAFDELRLEFVVNSDPAEEKKLTPCWFRENEEGTIKTTDGSMVPSPSSTEQTAVIDLEKSGIDLKTGIRAFHVHGTPGKGKFTITDARLMTSAPKAASNSNDSGEAAKVSDSNSSDSTATDSKSTNSTAASSDDNNSGSDVNSDSNDNSSASASLDDSDEAVGGGATAAPTTGSATYPIAIALGGILVAIVSLFASKKLKEDK